MAANPLSLRATIARIACGECRRPPRDDRAVARRRLPPCCGNANDTFSPRSNPESGVRRISETKRCKQTQNGTRQRAAVTPQIKDFYAAEAYAMTLRRRPHLGP